MRRHFTARMTMIAFIAALLAMLVGATDKERRAWSFSADVPSPVLASMTAHARGAAAPVVPPAAPATTGDSTGNGLPPPVVGNQPAGVGNQDITTDDEAPQESKPLPSHWPTILLAVALVIGAILLVLYLINRNVEA